MDPFQVLRIRPGFPVNSPLPFFLYIFVCFFRSYSVLEKLLIEDVQNTLRPFWFYYLVISADLLGKTKHIEIESSSSLSCRVSKNQPIKKRKKNSLFIALFFSPTIQGFLHSPFFAHHYPVSSPRLPILGSSTQCSKFIQTVTPV